MYFLRQVTVLGSPAEEGGGGKVRQLDDDVFGAVDVAMMCHPAPGDRTEMLFLARVT